MAVRAGSLNSAMLVDGNDSNKVRFRERGRARRNKDEARRRGKGGDDEGGETMRRRKDPRPVSA